MFGLLITLFTQIDTVYDLRDFRIPESGVTRLTLNLSGHMDEYVYSGWNYLDYPWDTFFNTSTRREQRGTTGGNYQLIREKERLSYSLGTALEFHGYSRESSSLEYTQFGYDTLYIRYDTLYNLQMNNHSFSGALGPSASLLYYPFGDVICVGFNSSLSIGGSIGKSTELRKEVSHDFFSTEEKQGFYERISFDPLIGFGRIRPLQYASNALEIEEVLSKDLIISKNPSLVKEVAELLARRWEYPIKYWQSDWEFYDDLEEIFVKYGIPREDIHIKTWMQIIDASSVWSTRPYGIRISIGPALEQNLGITEVNHRQEYDSLSAILYSYDRIHEFEARLNQVSLDFGYPLSNHTHLAGSIGLSLFPAFFYNIEHRFYVDLSHYMDTTIVEKELGIESYRIPYTLSSTTYFWNRFRISISTSGNYEEAPYYTPSYIPDTLISRTWANDFALSMWYTFTNKFSISIGGGIGTTLQKYTSGSPFFSANPHAGASLEYRIF